MMWKNNTSISGDISDWSSLNSLTTMYASTGMTYVTYEETEEEIRERKKQEIKSIIGDDKYLIQEIIAELRKDKIDQLLNNDV